MLHQRFLLSTALSSVALLMAATTANAQVTIGDARTTGILTSTANGGNVADDVTVTSDGSFELTDVGPAVTIDSDTNVTIAGGILISDVDNAVGVDVQGGNTGSLTLSGVISVSDTTEFTDTDGDNVIDGPFANGTGRTGILISGASPFVGNIQTTDSSAIVVEGADSFGIRLMEAATLSGDLLLDGRITALGANNAALSVEGRVIGNLANGASINVRGEGSEGVVIAGDIDGAYTQTGSVDNSGYRFTNRPNIIGRNLLQDEDRLQAGSAVNISGNIAGGITFARGFQTTTDADGVETQSLISTPSVTQQGSAAAVLIDGNGTPIAIGRVSQITDPDADGFDEDLLYAFINEGNITSAGVYDDVNTTTLEIRDATLDGGILNTGTMSALSYRSGDDGTVDADGLTGRAQVIIIGNGAIAERINNRGTISAVVLEAVDEVYADSSNIVATREINVVAIDVEAGGSLESIINSNTITASASGRNATVYAIRDASGTLSTITNTGRIAALGINSDANGLQATDFTTVAMDLSANTSGVSITQDLAIDEDPDDIFIPATPSIAGDILLGSGDDSIVVTAGTVVGAIDFGAGDEVLTLSGGSSYSGRLTNSEGELALSVTGGSSFANASSDVVMISDATFDGTSVYQPTLNGATGQAGTLSASGTVTFADGASIAPRLTNIIGTDNTVFRIADAGNLVIGGDVSALSGVQTPFLYNTTYSIDPNDPNALIITLDLRDQDELGLDRVQSAAFTSAFEALGMNTDLGDAFVNIADGGEFNRALNQLLPEFAAAARQFVIANVDGATGAVGAHLDSVRRSQDRPGGAWIQEFAYFADRDLAGLSEQYRGSGFGFTAGMDTAWGPFHAVGINAGFASTEIESVADQDEPLDVLSLQFGGYAGYQSGKLGIEALAGFGYNDFESERRVNIGNFRGTSDGDWSGTHYNATVRAGYDIALSDRFWARPTVSFDYLSLNEKAYTETGDLGVALDIDSRTSESGSATAMINFGAEFMGKRTWLRPGLRVGYRNEFIGDGVITTGRFAGMNTPFSLESEEFPNGGFLLGVTLAAGSEFSSFSFDLDSDIRDGFVRHTGRIVLRLLF